MFHVAHPLNVPKSIREDDTPHSNEREKDEDADDDLIFGALDDEKSPSTDEGIHLHSIDERVKKRERANSSISTADDEWDSMLPITEGDGLWTSVNHLKSILETNPDEQIIGMSNFRVKHRLHRRSRTNTLNRWKDAVKKVVKLKDPWLDFKIDQYPEETVIRHEFDPVKRIWHTSDVKVKIESKPLARGSMRECFRLKKLSGFSSYHDWDHSSNYIAKRYIDEVPESRYFDDVMMQMTTKLWAAHYNQHNPPKKVDIVQMSVLEFKDRTGRPYYHLERYIDGKYIKYNSNSGFVCDDTLRHTPQAFSHFTFEASCHEQIVVDIQGVGDLYTDPQIHTNLGFEYGEGNLGIRGMALFFYTHECNPICTRLNLTPFDMSSNEREHLVQQHLSSPTYASNFPASTACRGSEEPLNSLSKFGSLIRRLRSQSSISEDDSDGYVSEASSLTLATAQLLENSLSVPKQEQFMKTFSEESIPLSSSFTKIRIPILTNSASMSTPSPSFYSRSHSELSFNIEEIYKAQMPNSYGSTHRASSVVLEKAQLEKLREVSAFYEKYESILGQIHLEICKYYQVGRFSELGSEEYDETSAFFHLELAAELCVKEAIFALAKIYLDLPRDILVHYVPSEQKELFTKGFHMMLRASEFHETEANLFIAQYYDKGVEGLMEPNWQKATDFYEKYINLRENESNHLDEESETTEDEKNKNTTNNVVPFNDLHEIVARLAALYKTGEHHLKCDYQKSGDLFNKAAEMATAAMKGRLANKYYQSAEEAYALIPEDEVENS